LKQNLQKIALALALHFSSWPFVPVRFGVQIGNGVM